MTIRDMNIETLKYIFDMAIRWVDNGEAQDDFFRDVRVTASRDRFSLTLIRNNVEAHYDYYQAQVWARRFEASPY